MKNKSNTHCDEYHEPQTSDEYSVLMLDPDREFDMDPLELLLRREQEYLEAKMEDIFHKHH